MAADLAFHSLGLFGFYKSINLASCPLSILRSTRLSDPSPSIPTPGPWVPFLLALGLGLSQAMVQPMLAGSLVLGLAVAKVGRPQWGGVQASVSHDLPWGQLTAPSLSFSSVLPRTFPKARQCRCLP